MVHQITWGVQMSVNVRVFQRNTDKRIHQTDRNITRKSIFDETIIQHASKLKQKSFSFSSPLVCLQSLQQNFNKKKLQIDRNITLKPIFDKTIRQHKQKLKRKSFSFSSQLVLARAIIINS